jgi:hypothetical protein
MPVITIIIYFDVLVYFSPVKVTDMSINTRFKLEEKHENMTEDMKRMDTKYEELSRRVSRQVR